jgi:hypothetical protein
MALETARLHSVTIDVAGENRRRRIDALPASGAWEASVV